MNETDVRLVGTALVVPTVIGLVVGYLLDRWLGTAPWLAMIGLGFGIVSGFVNVSSWTRDTRSVRGTGRERGPRRSGQHGRRSGGEVIIDSIQGGRDAVERDQAAMTIEYESTTEDVVNFQSYCWRHKMPWVYWFGYALALANGLVLGRLRGGPGFTARSIVFYVACSGLFLLLWSVFVYVIAPLIAKRMIQKGKNLGVVGRHTIRLEAGGCRETTDVNEAFQAWRGIDTIEADARYLYIFLPGWTGYIIPRRAFPNIAASDEFFAAARRLHAASSGLSV